MSWGTNEKGTNEMGDQWEGGPVRGSQHEYLPILDSQYHGCWCPGDARSQGINNNDIDYVEPEYDSAPAH